MPIYSERSVLLYVVWASQQEISLKSLGIDNVIIESYKTTNIKGGSFSILSSTIQSASFDLGQLNTNQKNTKNAPFMNMVHEQSSVDIGV